ncbi:MAG: polyamine aminopropyltransferase [Deltaproteobacteria bacterium]|nr:polyamine aminopropyltransferase [Deltaproteobacteria bacterium]
MSSPRGVSTVLKISVFATGCAGIVAEFVLSTLATYIVGNAIFQWTIVMSLMFFAMGLGSRLSAVFRHRLLDAFIIIEFSLSLLCASSAALAYGLVAYTVYARLMIYTQAFVIGLLIGLEIPLVTRLNQAYEELRSNIAGVMEKDYYGALVGGLLFAFFALPHLGLTYTPIALGAINFLVAALLLFSFFGLLSRKKVLVSAFAITCAALITLGVLAKPIILFGEQRQYRDKVIFAKQTVYQKIVITQWKKHYWLFINGQEQFSTYDEEKYHEPLVHPAMKLAAGRDRVLILGGGDGLALREVLKYPEVTSVTLVDLDPAITKMAQTHPVLVEINQGAMNDPRVKVINQDAAVFLREDAELYDLIFIDLPDPDTIDLMHVYSLNFYRLAHRHLKGGGMLAAQATSPYFARQAFLCIMKTIEAAGFSVLPYHNQVPTMGEWAWVLGARREDIKAPALRRRVLMEDFNGLDTRFFNTNAMISMAHFGKGVLDGPEAEKIKINTKSNPVLMRYYLAGTWGAY